MKRILLATLLLLGIASTGCSRQLVLHPISDEQIVEQERNGVKGWWISDWYMREIMEVAIESK